MGLVVPAAAQTVQPSPQADPQQSRSVFDLSQRAQSATSPELRMPRVAAAAPQADTKPFVKLTGVSVEGAYAVDAAAVAEVYGPYIGRTVSQADLVAMAAGISDLYRRAGYHLSRAIIPPQDVSHGRVRVLMVEGSITDVVLKGDPTDRFGVRRLLAPVAAERPSRIATLERQLTLINELPGLRIADSTLDEIGPGSGRFRLVVTVRSWDIYAAVGLDNLGSYAVGPLQTYATATLNSYLMPGDALTVSLSAVPHDPQQLAYGLLSYDAPIGIDGIRVGASAWHSTVWPGDARSEFGDRTDSDAAELRVSMAPLATQQSSLRLTVAVGAGEFTEKSDFGTSYTDRVRTMSFAADYSLDDILGGRDYFGLAVRQGIGAFGASQIDDFTSRYNASGAFSIINVAFNRLQPLSDAWSVRLAGAAQFASSPLFLSQQFYLGGSAFGRGYDAALVSGDNGVAGTAELRFDQRVGARFLERYQLYAFVDAGAVWDVDDDYGALSLASVGVGARLFLPGDWQAGVAVAFPVGYRTLDFETHGGPRLLFSLSETFKSCPRLGQFRCE